MKFPPINNEHIMTKERWESILLCKNNFLQNSAEDPRQCPQMNPEIAASWIRSRNLGVSPSAQVINQRLDPQEVEKILHENHVMIDIAAPLFNTFKDFVISSSYQLYLWDIHGVTILHEGEMTTIPLGHEPIIGTLWNEDTIGTCAHVLSKRLKRPVQLLGPEHYCVVLRNITASAAPILDESGEVMAVLVLSQPLMNPPWEESYQNLRSHTLGLITTMAAAIEAQIKLKKSNEALMMTNDSLATTNGTLEVTLACVDEGIITIDQTGTILRSNQEGTRILRMKADEMGRRNIRDFLDSQSSLMSQAERGENVDIEETICAGNDRQPYVISIRPVLNQDTRKLDVAVLRLNHAEKVNALVTKRSGATANFTFEDIIGESGPIKEAITRVQRFATSPENILLAGESGTGKELFAQSIHNTYCPYGPFMAVNCAALPRELIESELFGYEGGSFTGAERNGRPGKIELANGGTLFLDEIGDMPFELQAVLLRVLEDKQVMRIGGRRYKKVDFRVIAATHKNLFEMVQENLFREDLYFRLSVLSVHLPPLRDRGGDREVFSRYFIDRYCRKLGWKVPQISPEAQKKINEYDWPGNVRQLENAMIYAVNTTQGKVIELENLPDEIWLGSRQRRFHGTVNSGDKATETLSLKELERAAIDLAMLKAHNSVSLAADFLEISKPTLYRKLKEYNIRN
jgi:transcriptional regulator with PAS, ATPase and Fis domain